jgi:hypothetical protein
MPRKSRSGILADDARGKPALGQTHFGSTLEPSFALAHFFHSKTTLTCGAKSKWIYACGLWKRGEGQGRGTR